MTRLALLTRRPSHSGDVPKTATTLSHWGTPLAGAHRSASRGVGASTTASARALGAISARSSPPEPARTAACDLVDLRAPRTTAVSAAAVYGAAHAIIPPPCIDPPRQLPGRADAALRDVPPPPDFRTDATCQKARRAMAESGGSATRGRRPDHARAVGVHVRVPEGAALGHLEQRRRNCVTCWPATTRVVGGEHAGDAANVARSSATTARSSSTRAEPPRRGRWPRGHLAVHGSSFPVPRSCAPAAIRARAPIHGATRARPRANSARGGGAGLREGRLRREGSSGGRRPAAMAMGYGPR